MVVHELYQALEALAPTDFSTVPIGELSTYLKDTFRSAAVIASSIPSPPDGDETPLDPASKPTGPPNPARTASDVKLSTARPPGPTAENEKLRKHWGKPLKISAKENAAGVTVWKMAGHDRHGAWFARRSVHEGLGFDKWKRAMKKEFAASHAVEGGPGAGAIRGIGADRLVVREVVEGVGTVEVWHLSAQFPGPVAPREFLIMVLTTEEEFGQAEGGGRSYMMVSIPVDHEDAPARDGLVRGQYESVEMIREVPIISSASGGKSEDPELNPVEWTMVTRSDPGGGIPRFLVERETPGSIAADTTKFLNWATRLEDEEEVPVPEVQDHETVKEAVPESNKEISEQPARPKHNETSTPDRSSAPSAPVLEQPTANDSGIIASITGAVQSTVEAYAPNPVLEHLPTSLFSSKKGQEYEANHYDGMDDSTTDTDSIDSFESAVPYRTAEEGQYGRDRNLSVSSSSTENPLASKSQASLAGALGESISGRATPNSAAAHTKNNEKELRKLIDRKKDLDQRHAARIERDAKKREELSQKSTRDVEKKRERIAREERRTAERYNKEIAKIEARQRKEQRRIEQKIRKEEEKDRFVKTEHERDGALQDVERLQHENEGLKMQVSELQRQLTALVREVGRIPGGQDILTAVQEDVATPRGSSPTSERSKQSKTSMEGRRRSKLSVDSNVSM